jgi:predicted methyltransferase
LVKEQGMFKPTLGLVLLACLAISTSAAANNPFVGDWKLDPSKSTRTDKMTVESVGDSKYTFNFGGGSETIVVDGTDQPTVLYGGGTLSVAIEGDTWKVVRKSNGRTIISAIWSVSRDGSTLTDHYTGFNAGGSPYNLIYTYERKAAGSGFAGTWVSTSEEAVDFVLGLQLRPFEENGLSIIDPSSQIMGDMNFAAPLVRRRDEHTLDLMRKKSDGGLSDFLHLELSSDLKTLTITPRSAAGVEPHILAFDRTSAIIPAAQEAGVPGEAYRALLANPVRTERDRRMDESRHPLELLQFAQVQSGMRVLDFSAGAGYTSQLLALAVGPSGKVWAQTPKPGAALNERMATHPQANLLVTPRPFEDPVPPDAPPLDLVTLVLNYHDISYLPVDRDAMNRKIFAALKRGGRYVVVDHAALPGTGITAGKTLHRIDEAFVVEEVKRAGFVLDAEGAFMRNAADPRTGSSNQPPSSDKFMLRFVRP